MGKQKLGGTKFEAKNWDKYTYAGEIWDELFRVSKNQIVWGGNYFMSKIQRDSPCWIFWDNNGDSLFADGEMAWTSFTSPIRLAKYIGAEVQLNTKRGKIKYTQHKKAVQLTSGYFKTMQRGRHYFRYTLR